MKRTHSVSENTRSKKPRLNEPLEYSKKNNDLIISATHVYNYMLKDTLVDWLKLRNRSGTRSTPVYTTETFTEFIMKRGVEFENELINYIHVNRLPVQTVSDKINESSIEFTKILMYQGVPIIHSAPVLNKRNNTQGIIDLLVRSDYISDLVDIDPLSDVEKTIPSPKLGVSYHYLVIDIKFSTLPLRSDGVHILNSGSYPAYKAQCLIYTEAIGNIQGYTPKCAFIMGRRWRCTNGGGVNHNYTCLNKLGRISYDTVDQDYIQRTKDAIKWCKNVRKYGNTWSINPPSREELYPNMCVDSGVWNEEKEKIADRIGEITNIWYVNIKHRKNALDKGIDTWRDNGCTTKALGFNGVRARIVDQIMDINRQNIEKIRPNIIMNNIANWQTHDTQEIYVDFETLSDVFADFGHLPEQNCTEMIFMIGVGWSQNGVWKYTNWVSERPTYDEEYRIMNRFVEFVARRGFPKMFHWCAENKFWRSAECRQFDFASEDGDHDKKEHISEEWKKIGEWVDVCSIFQSEPIVVKGCFKFGLKSIAKAMHSHGMISTCLNSQCDSGMTAMIKAWKVYNNSDNPRETFIMKDISKYNEFDTKVLWEILRYLRNNHCIHL